MANGVFAGIPMGKWGDPAMGQPGASNMQTLSWSAELEKMATDVAI